MNRLLCMGNTLSCVVLELLLLSCTCGYNLDTKFPIIYSGSDGSYFGYTTALHKNQWGPLSLIGAPKANTTTFSDPVYQPGTLFRCNITKKNGGVPCQEVMLMKEGANDERRDYMYAYRDYKHGMWLGVSLDVRPVSRGSDIVTCGHLWKNSYHPSLHLVNGVCYVINEDLEESSILKLLPLTQRDMQYGTSFDGKTEYNYAHGQAGMSATYSQDGSQLILGAPGVWSWTGSIVNYPVNSDSTNYFYRNPNVPSPAYEIKFNSYFGYSVTTGSFFESWPEFIAVGAPKDGGNYGKVYIIRQARERMIIHQRKQGFQLGEYFGASILGINLNGDPYTDLLVGAPLNSIESSGDEGKVYVFLSNGMDLEKDTELLGDRKTNARFGTSLANIGDLNQDGLADIAVGAPYEDERGAIYIYHGSKLGIKSQYAQKVMASEIHPKLSGFGIHISRGTDIDDNGYPDILVGSYASANAVLLRSRPMIHVFAEMIFDPRQININQTLCDLNGRNLTCVQIDACVWYTGERVPNLKIEFAIGAKDPGKRASIAGNARKDRLTSRLNLDAKHKICSPFEMYIRPGIKDFITPITVQFSHKLVVPAGSDKEFNEAFPMYHPKSEDVITADITFQTGCGKEDECRSDLIVSATRTEPVGDRLITLGTVSRVAIVITVKNKGEPAYLSELHIYLPPEMPSINQDFCEAGKQQNNASLVCDLGNPLRNDTEVEIHIKMDATKIPPHTKYLEIVCRGVTLSTDVNEDDNTEVVPLHLKSISDIGITGVSSHDQIMYDGSQDATPVVTHTYIIRNHGPSPLHTIEILLEVPFQLLTSDGKETFLTLTGLEGDSNSRLAIPTVCQESSISIKEVLPRSEGRGKVAINDDEMPAGDRENSSFAFAQNYGVEPPSDLKKTSDERPDVHLTEKKIDKNNTSATKARGHFVIDCNNDKFECVVLRCSAAPFINPRKFARLSVDFQLNFTVLNEYLGSWYEIEFLTTASISVPETSVIQMHQHPNVAQVRTVILHEGPPPPEELAAWIIFVSVGVGVILLLLILILLIKIGFFKRKEKDKMKEMLIDAKKEEGNVPQDVDDSEPIAE